jgi:alcohol dehydrogenase (cytochrome c)
MNERASWRSSMHPNVFFGADKHCASVAVLVCCCLAAALAVSPLRTSSAQAERLLTQAQAERGKPLYAQHCASCHGQSLEGTPANPLAGERFMAKWGQGGYTIDDLYYVTKMQMPYGKPDSLTARQYIDIVAFILASNGYPTGAGELPADSAFLKKIKITRQTVGGARAASGPAPAFISSGEKASSARPTQAELNAAHANATDWLLPNHDYAGRRQNLLSARLHSARLQRARAIAGGRGRAWHQRAGGRHREVRRLVPETSLG